MKKGKQPTPEAVLATRKKLFLDEFCKNGNISLTCKTIKVVARSDVFNWRRDDPEFLAAFKEAEEESIEHLEAEAFRRAKEGVREGIYHRGKRVGYVLRYSDKLLLAMLRARNPGKWGYQVNVKGEMNHGHQGHVTLGISMQDVLNELDKRQGNVGPGGGDPNAGAIRAEGEQGKVGLCEALTVNRLSSDGGSTTETGAGHRH